MCRGFAPKHLTSDVVENAIGASVKRNNNEIVTASDSALQFSNVVAHFERKFLETYTSSDKKVLIVLSLNLCSILSVNFSDSFQQSPKTFTNC